MFPDGIRALVRTSSNIETIKNLLPQAELVTGNILDKSVLKRFLYNVDTLIHIAGIGFSNNIVEVAVDCKVRRLILVHTTGIYSKYKAAGERYREIEKKVYKLCKDNGIALTICRPTMIYGNLFDNNIIKFVKMVDKLPIMPVVNGARYDLQPVHYKDLAKAYYDILINEEKTVNKDYILSGGAPIQLREIFEIVGEKLGKKVRFVSCPFSIAYFGACVLWCFSIGKIDYREKVQRLCEPRVYSFKEAAIDFGYAPVTFDVGICEEIDQYKSLKNR